MFRHKPLLVVGWELAVVDKPRIIAVAAGPGCVRGEECKGHPTDVGSWVDIMGQAVIEQYCTISIH